MNIQNKKILASILFVLISFVCIAQDVVQDVGKDAPQSDAEDVAQDLPQPPNGPPPPPGLPIDGFSTVAVLFGAYFGIKKTFQNSKN